MRQLSVHHVIIVAATIAGIVSADAAAMATDRPTTYYVDPAHGNDAGPGSLDGPFATIEHALAVVGERVDRGIVSDRIYLRGGVYRNTSTETVYRLKLKGTPYGFALLSAMPCEPHTPGAVQRKSGKWYEKVIIDDGQRISTPWTRVPDHPDLWMTKPGFTRVDWGSDYGGDQLWNWRGYVPSIGESDTPSNKPQFCLAPYMMLQDGTPLLWEDKFSEITAPGTRSFDQATGILYVRPLGDKDPNKAVFESWYGGPDREGKALLDGEGRALMDGYMEYAEIRGIEFRMFERLMENHLVYKNEDERIIQRNVRFEDNQFTDGWVHFLLDVHEHLLQGYTKGLAPRFTDRSGWVIRDNIFLRSSREVWQIHGENHLFEANDVIDFRGPWTGPAAISGVINSRNSRNPIFRYNRVLGAGHNKWWPDAIFGMELRPNHQDPNRDESDGGETFEYNLVTDVARGAIFAMGRSSCRMRNVTIRHNIIASNETPVAIEVTSPHLNLTIENNVFYGQRRVISVSQYDKEPVTYDSMPSTIGIHDNIFAECAVAIDPRLLSPAPGSSVVIDRNIYWPKSPGAIGANAITADPRFRDPKRLDFRISSDSPAVLEGHDIGVYDLNPAQPR